MATHDSPFPHSRLALVQKHPALSYFLATFTISWSAAFIVAAPSLVRREAIPRFTGLMMFPAMLLGPSLAGVGMTWLTQSGSGLRDLARRLTKIRVRPVWYAALLIFPAVMWIVLRVLESTLSPIFTPNYFWIGLSFGIVAGLVEEIGWMGFAYPTLVRRFSPLRSAIMLGIVWGLWHIPVIDYLGTATPHGPYWLPYLLVFLFAMSAVRVLICWIYRSTGSVFLCQLMHAASTGSLVVLSPARVNARQEVFWYLIYGAALWIVAAWVIPALRARDF